MKKFLFLVVSVTLVISCTGINRYMSKKNGLLEGKAKTKNIIFMIVDGMGLEHVKAARIFNGQKPFNFEHFSCSTKVTTCSYDGADTHGQCVANTNNVTDSAAAATAMATGFKVINGAVSLEAKHGQAELKTILEMAKAQEKSTGVVATKLFTDATPAAFISHADYRDQTEEILKDIFDQTKPTVIFGADNDLHRAHAEASGLYRMVNNASDLKRIALSLEKGPACQACPHIYGGFGQYEMPGYKKKAGLPLEVLDHQFAKHDVPHLSEMTDAALKILNKNDKGFFLMVESSMPDMISHYNTQMDGDNGSPSAVLALVKEMMEVEKTVKVIENFVKKNPNTLLVVTADHETGGLMVEEDKTACLGQKHCVPEVKWTSKKYLPTDESPSRHTNADVPLYALGQGSKRFCQERINNIDIPRLARAE